MRFVPKPAPDPQQVQALIDGGLRPVTAQLLVQRGLTTPQQARRFLSPDAGWLRDPMTLHDMGKAVARLRQAIAGGERIVVYGDYDADGVTAVSVLLGYFQSIGVQAGYYIPGRHEEGYGLNEQAVRDLAKDYSLMVTVDCGIASHEEVALAQSLGLDVIVTDHHQLKPTLPGALAVLNPLLDGYGCPYLCGAGVALKLVQALGGLDAALEQIDLAAIGTVADIVPLTDENRAIAALGLEKMNQNRRVGIQALCQTAHLANTPLRSGHIGFTLGPRINAGGRIDRSGRTVELMLTQDAELGAQLAAQLDGHNLHRQQLEKEILQQCEEKIAQEVDFLHDRAIVLWGDGWNVGVVGIVASRMTDKYTMPCVLLSRSGDTLTGSGRSIRGVHLLDAISACGDCLTRFGGHEMAAGLSLPLKRFDEFRRRFNDYLTQNIPAECFEPTVLYDVALDAKAATLALCEELDRLEPCGMGNPVPQFLLEGVLLDNLRPVGFEGHHVRGLFGPPRNRLTCVGYAMADQIPTLRAPTDLVIQLRKSEWAGRTTVQGSIRKLKPARCAFWQELDAHLAERMTASLETFWDWDPLDVPDSACEPWDGTPRRGDLLLLLDARNAQSAGFDGLDFWIGRPETDPRAFPALLAAPLLDAPLAPYRRFVFLEGFDPPAARALRERCPQAVFCAPEAPLKRRPVLPDLEGMRAVYQYIRRHGPALSICADARTAAKQVAQQTGYPPLTALCALKVFDQLGFLRVTLDPWALTLCPNAPRRDLTESPAYRYLSALGALRPGETDEENA